MRCSKCSNEATHISIQLENGILVFPNNDVHMWISRYYCPNHHYDENEYQSQHADIQQVGKVVTIQEWEILRIKSKL